MQKPLVCLCLTAKTLEEDMELANRYRHYIDLVELRVDLLDEDERLFVRDFPSMINLPCILTIRRLNDGGQYQEGEASRTMLFARALAFAEADVRKNFAYVDFEEDFHVPSLQDAALAFGTKIIRSYHEMHGPIQNLKARLDAMRTTGFEIPKIACMPRSLADVTEMFKEAEKLEPFQQILCAMGPLGFPTRVLSGRLNSFLTYTTAKELLPQMTVNNGMPIGHIDPKTLSDVYRFRQLNKDTVNFGITGWPLKVTSSPKIHNKKFDSNGMNAVFLQFPSETVNDAFMFAKLLDLKGFSVTIPHKEKIISLLNETDTNVKKIGACNTVINDHGIWKGFNTDAPGFKKALVEFTGLSDLTGKKVAIIGAGGASRAIAYALKELGAEVCVFNRTITRARTVAELFGFSYATLGPESLSTLHEFSDIIVQTTSKGMGAEGTPNQDNDPLYFYDFNGTEMLYDIIYSPEITPVMVRAKEAGCKVCNGLSMLHYQGDEQFKLYREMYENAQSK
ncbi:MAG: type I 3-dehydroquinate dehydratase [Treponema sp.]|nr:type I 3-dehydroquinate dehydratase [Treponema sp.]